MTALTIAGLIVVCLLADWLLAVFVGCWLHGPINPREAGRAETSRPPGRHVHSMERRNR
jgi:hypothetical protein